MVYVHLCIVFQNVYMLRGKIIETAVLDLARLGVRECSMNSIAARLHISKKTIYETFGSKQNMLCECIKFCIDRNIEQLRQEEQSRQSPIITLVALNRLALRHTLEFCPVFHHEIRYSAQLSTLIDNHYTSHLRESYVRCFMAGITRGVLVEDMNMHHALRFFDEQLRIMSRQSTWDALCRIENYAFTILTYLAGISTDTGRDELKDIRTDYFCITPNKNQTNV